MLLVLGWGTMNPSLLSRQKSGVVVGAWFEEPAMR